MGSLRKKKRRLERKITSLFKKEITNKDLIDTGALRRSVDTSLVKRNKVLEIDIRLMYYFKYLDEPYDVSEDVFKTREFKKVSNEIVDTITEELFVDIPKGFKSSDSVNYSFKR